MYAVIDLEMCKVPDDLRTKEYPWATEIIQIGAALLDDEYQLVDKFNSYVKPEIGYIDYFIEELTGIHEDDVKDAPDLKTALESFSEWLPENCTGVSWSTADVQQFKHEMSAKKIKDSKIEKMLTHWVDCQPIFTKKLKLYKNYKLSEALIIADLDMDGREHDGLSDAVNTAKLYSKMMTEKELKLNPAYEYARKTEHEPLQFGLGELLKDFKSDEP